MKKRILIILLLAALLTGCAKNADNTPALTAATEPTRPDTRTIYICTSQTLSSGGSVTRTDYILDAQNQVRQVVVYTNENETMRYEVECDANGNYIRWVNGDISSTYTYDQQGRPLLKSFYHGDTLTGSVEQVWEGNLQTALIARNGNQEQRTAYYYNESGQKIREELYQNSVLVSYAHLTLNEDGQPASQNVYLADGTLSATISYTYDGTTVTATSRDSDGNVQKNTEDTYDAHGNLTATTVFDAEGNVLTRKTNTWTPIQVPVSVPRASI